MLRQGFDANNQKSVKPTFVYSQEVVEDLIPDKLRYTPHSA